MTAPLVSVVVATYQRADRLPDLFRALESQTLSSDSFEVVIVDDASDDDTPAVLDALAAASPLTVHVLRQDVNGGAARARNVGAAEARAEILAFTDDDCQPTPHWLEAGLAAFTDADIHAVQGRTEPVVAPGPWAATREWRASPATWC